MINKKGEMMVGEIDKYRMSKVTDEEVKMVLTSSNTPECDCDGCKDMCENRPCWGSPREIMRIMVTHPELVSCLGEDYYALPKGDVPIIVGSVPECRLRSGRYPFWPTGRCGLLDDDKRCKIHALKPIEGRAASCNHDEWEDRVMTKLHHDIIPKTWNKKYGKKVVTLWREMYSKYSSLQPMI
jgi:hypothetical protein